MSETTKRQAEEARRLAMECAEGIAPPMINSLRHDGRGGHCALGIVEARSGSVIHIFDEPYETIVACANNYENPEHVMASGWLAKHVEATNHRRRQARLVFPLLSLADALEAQ